MELNRPTRQVFVENTEEREYKFRAYDIANKKILEWEEIMTWSLIALNVNSLKGVRKYMFDQSTGIKDKNKKEIYVRDIVRVSDGMEFIILFANSNCITCVGFKPMTNKGEIIEHLHGVECEVVSNYYKWKEENETSTKIPA